MDWDQLLDVSKTLLLCCGVFLIICVAILIGIWLLATALYVIPAKQRKINLKDTMHIKNEQRIYLDEYQYTIANKKLNDEIEQLENQKQSKRKEIKELKKELEELKQATATQNKKKKSKGLEITQETKEQPNV